MDDDNKNDRWMKLCELAKVEQDSKKLIELTNEIARLLDERRRSGIELSATMPAKEGTQP